MSVNVNLDQNNNNNSTPYYSLNQNNNNNNSISYYSLIKNESEVDYTQELPDELIQHIFSFLNNSELKNCTKTNSRWLRLATDKTFLDSHYSEPKEAFGEAKWNTYFGKTEKIPHLPNNINEILESPCPIWGSEGKKTKDTHILFYNPKEIDGQPHTINNIGKLVTSPKKGSNATHYRHHLLDAFIAQEHGEAHLPIKVSGS